MKKEKREKGLKFLPWFLGIVPYTLFLGIFVQFYIHCNEGTKGRKTKSELLNVIFQKIVFFTIGDSNSLIGCPRSDPTRAVFVVSWLFLAAEVAHNFTPL